MIKEKKCNGKNKAISFNGCGKTINVAFLKYGLCRSCYAEFLTETEAGKIIFHKALLKGKSEVKKQEKANVKEAKDKQLTPDKYRSKTLQPNINKIARLIDYGCSCIATNKFGKMNGGHRISVGANRSVALNLHNIHIQSFHSNHFKSGDNLKYDIGIKERYGSDYLEFLNSLHQTETLHLSVNEFKEINVIALRIIKELKTVLKEKTPTERIELRNKYNTELGIYNERFCIFTINN